jgi:ribonuclease P protein component
MIFFLYYLKNDLATGRFAISVNKKIGNAVARNFIKRKFKEWYRQNGWEVPFSCDVWISVKKPFDRRNGKTTERFFLEALKKIG